MRIAVVLTILCTTLSASAISLSAPATRPAILDKVSIDQRLGKYIPLDLPFRDDNGGLVTLRDCFHGRPVILTPVYYDCPMLCTLTLNQLTRSINMISQNVGQQFDIITFSFDPRETPDLAAQKKRTYLKAYRREGAEAGWHFLTGSPDSIRKLTDAIGFHYTWDPANKIYAHASGIMVLTPQGKISRYFLGVDYPTIDLQKALADASKDAVAPAPAEQIFLYCFHYDPTTGKYGLIIDRAIQVFGIATLVALVSLIAIYLRRERRMQVGAEGG
jgi:protein SCO1/2